MITSANLTEKYLTAPAPNTGTPVADGPRFNRDDTFYKVATLQQYADSGMDVSELRVANLMEGADGPGGFGPVRGLQNDASEWDFEIGGLIGRDYKRICQSDPFTSIC